MALDLTNKVFGQLTAIKDVGKRGGHRLWLCQCDCGKERTVKSSQLSTGLVKSCGCEHAQRGTTNAVIARYKRQAAERNLAWELSYEQAHELTRRPCWYCHATPANALTHSQVKYNGIDRIDNKQGYIKGNVVPCCITCNRAKSDLTLSEFHAWIIDVYENSIMDKN